LDSLQILSKDLRKKNSILNYYLKKKSLHEMSIVISGKMRE